ncbi:GLE1-domain-containing protein [Martensiomyces pterosporus]|nr:GLE1-domain-containing protein [Martensiomyces pterosporus]
MKYGLFLGLDSSDASSSEPDKKHLTVKFDAKSKSARRKTASPIKRQAVVGTSFVFGSSSAHSSPTGSLFERKRRSTSLADEPRLADLSGWRLFNRRNLGTPFPGAAGARGSTLSGSSYSKASHFRELAEKVKVKHRKISGDDVESIRARACQTYAQPIHRELEETRKFLAQLSVSVAAADDTGRAGDIDKGVQDTLKRLDQLRQEYEQKQKEEEEAKLRIVREAEEKMRQEKERIAQQAEKEAEDMRLAEQQQRQQQEQEQQKQLAARKQAAEQHPAPAESATAGATGWPSAQVSPDALQWAEGYRASYRSLMDSLAPKIRENKEVKSYCFMQKGLITRSIGQLKDSQEFVNRISQKIIGIIDESARYGPDAQTWVINLTAKAIVKQAETEVTVHRNIAYPLAAVAVNVMLRHPGLVDLFLVRLVKKCPYIVPQFIGRKPNQSSDEFLRSIGYKEKDDDVLETDVMYEERMNGMLSLYAAVLQTTPPNSQPNPFPVAHGWTWLARITNLRPRAISPSLVNTFLEIAGASMMAAYGAQFKKALDFIARHWVPAIPLDEPLAVASKSRLSTYMDTYVSTGTLKQVEGRNIKPY